VGLSDTPIPVAFLSVSYHGLFSMAHHKRQIRSGCVVVRARGPLHPRNPNQRPPVQRVDLMKTVYPEEDYCRKSLTLSIVPEVDEEEEEGAANALLTASPGPNESPKTLKRKRSLVELVVDVALLMRRRVKGKF